MRVWIVAVTEPLPTDPGGVRLLRAGKLCRALTARGHQVKWWASTFDHFRRVQRSEADATVTEDTGLEMTMLHGPGYRRNVGLGRLYDHGVLAWKFTSASTKGPAPDVILCAMPTLELSAAAVRFGRLHGIPVAVDIRDLWPDIFLECLPVWARQWGQILIGPYSTLLQYVCRNAACILGPCEYYVDWGLRKARRERGGLDRVFPFGYSSDEPSQDDIRKALNFWDGVGLRLKGDEDILCFFGTIGKQFDFDTIIQCARSASVQMPKVRFVICGTGENLPRLKDAAADLPNVLFPGWVNTSDIWVLMRHAKAGLAPYRDSENFRFHMPNKPIEYLSAGLPIIAGFEGYLSNLVRDRRCGVAYQSGDADEMLRAIHDLLDNEPQWQAFSRNAKSLFETSYRESVVYGDLVKFLEDLPAAAFALVRQARSHDAPEQINGIQINDRP